MSQKYMPLNKDGMPTNLNLGVLGRQWMSISFIWALSVFTPVHAQLFKGQGIRVQIVDIPRPTAPANLLISDIQFGEGAGGEVNEMLDAEETATISFKISNSGKGDAYRMVLHLETLHTFTGIRYEQSIALGNLAAGATKESSFTLKGNRDLVNGEANFKMQVTEANGFDSDFARLRFKTQAFKSPELSLVDAVFTNVEGEGQITLAKMVHLQMLVQNRGQGTARDVVVQIRNPDKVFAADQTEYRFAELAPNAVERIDYEFFANKQYALPEIALEVRAIESHGHYGFQESRSVSLTKVLAKTQTLELEGRRSDQVVISDASLLSDVDKNIPRTAEPNSNRYALVIGNEDYSTYQPGLNQEANVAFARNDARVVKEYFRGVLGVPEANIDYLTDATSVRMSQAIGKLAGLIKLNDGKAEVFVYYAGHGLPDESKEPYLIPVDVTGSNVRDGIRLSTLYGRLTEFPAARITIFLDACFSGAARGQELFAMRGVKIKANTQVSEGNMVVFAASSGDQGALPYREKQHGIFTYHLLKKWQEKGSDLSYPEMHRYLAKEVGIQSLKSHNKDQTPQLLLSPEAEKKVDTWKFN
jgi:hypothetical protein